MTKKKLTRTPHQRSNAKGRRLQKLAQRYFEAQGYLVETAPNVVRWIMFPGDKALKPRSFRHDFFNVWDLIVVAPLGLGSPRFFVQVTDIKNVAHRRAKILASGFPSTSDDKVMGYEGRSIFRAYDGPAFTKSYEVRVPPEVRRGRVRKPKAEVA